VPQPLYSEGRAPSVCWIGGRMNLKTDLDVVEKRKIFSPCQEFDPISSVIHPQPRHCSWLL